MTRILRSGRVGLLQVQRPGQRDVAVEMALVELVEDQRGDPGQSPVLDHLPQQHAFGDEADAGLRAGDVLETDLVADLAAELGVPLPGDARGQQARGQPARLQDDDLPASRQPVLQQHLRHLGGFAGTGRRRDDQPPVFPEPGHNLVFDVVYRQSVRHGATMREIRSGCQSGHVLLD